MLSTLADIIRVKDEMTRSFNLRRIWGELECRLDNPDLQPSPLFVEFIVRPSSVYVSKYGYR